LSPIANTPSSLTAPETRAGFAFEIQHRVDHVFEHARAGDAAFLGHVTDQEHAGAGLLGEAHELGRRLAHLADRTRRSGEQFGPDGLDRIDDQQVGPARRGFAENAFDRGFCERFEAIECDAEPLAARSDLGQAFLAGHVEPAHALPERAEHLQQQGRFTDAGIAADQHHRAGDESAAEHTIEFGDTGRAALFGFGRHARQLRHLRRARCAGITAARCACRFHRRLHDEFGQRVPGAAVDTLALPLRMLGAAFAADVGGFSFGHAGSVLRRGSRDRNTRPARHHASASAAAR
jgi:hypothetical protein